MFGTMKVLGMEAPVHSMQMIKNSISVEATFLPPKALTLTPKDKITLYGVDGGHIYTTQSETPRVEMMPGDSLTLDIHVKPEVFDKRWAFGRPEGES